MHPRLPGPRAGPSVRVEKPMGERASVILDVVKVKLQSLQNDVKDLVRPARLTGLRGGVNPVQTPQTNIQVMVRAQKASLGHFLPFLGEVQDVHGTAANGRVTYTLPPITKGAVFWYDAATVPRPYPPTH